MIRKLSFDELIDAVKNLPSAEQVLLVAAIKEQLATSGQDQAQIVAALAGQPPADKWADIAVEGLARAYGQAEPQYSDKDLVPCQIPEGIHLGEARRSQ